MRSKERAENDPITFNLVLESAKEKNNIDKDLISPNISTHCRVDSWGESID